MKTLSLFFILILSFVGLSAQDTIPAPAPGQGKGRVEYDRRVHDTVYIHDQVSPKKLITEKYLLHLRNRAIILSSVGVGLIPIGTGLVVAGTRHEMTTDPTGDIGFGSLLITAGVGVTFTGVGTWIYYAVKLHKYKMQQDYPAEYHKY